MRKSSNAEGLRFLIAGGSNAAASYLLYLLLLPFLPYAWAYSLSFAAGVLTSWLLNSLVVFRVPLRWQSLLRFPLVYLVQYLLGLGVLALLVVGLGVDARLGPLAVLAATVPVSFLLTRWVLRQGGNRKSRDYGG